MSTATIDRKLQRLRHQQGLGPGITRLGTLLKQSIPPRTCAEWDEVQPGFLKMDLVAHWGETAQGQCLNTLTATDFAIGWLFSHY
jgi:hypothetical protein